MFASLLVYILFAVLGLIVAYGLMRSNAATDKIHATRDAGRGQRQRPTHVQDGESLENQSARYDEGSRPTSPMLP